jgi:uncharacterized NAD-dependent epimerase/dehydratase family protein
MTRPAAAVATFGRLDQLDAKMAHGILRYCDNVVAVVDERHAGGDLRALLPYADRDLPIVADVGHALRLGARELVVGAAPPGGAAAPVMLDVVRAAVDAGMWVVSGLHTRLTDLPKLAGFADRVVELRHRRVVERVATGEAAKVEANVLLTVGSDCAAGKMTTALEIWRGLGADCAAFIATGQTGMYIAGDGVAVDAVRADFTAGVTEQLVLDAAAGGARYVLVEGQGAILHPAYSGVSLALLHGAAPNLLVFCHDLGRPRLAYFDHDVADVAEEITLLEQLAGHQRKAAVIAVVAMAGGLDPEWATRERRTLSDRLGLPVLSPDLAGFAELTALVAEF